MANAVIDEQVIYAPPVVGQTINADGTITITNADGSITTIQAPAQRVVITGDPIQHKERYSRIAGQEWQLKVSVQGYTKRIDVNPIEMVDGTPLTPLETLLSDDSGLMIVSIVWANTKHYLCSPKCKAWIELMKEQKNPHRSPVSNGLVEVKPFGQTTIGTLTRVGSTIPVIGVDVEAITTIGGTEELPLRTAGIKDVEFIYETPSAQGTTIPSGLIQQINYTIARAQERAHGKYTNYIIKFLRDDYRAYIDEIRASVTVSQQISGSVFSGANLNKFQENVYPIWQAIQRDVNALKGMFYNGIIPTDQSLGTAPQINLTQPPPGTPQTTIPQLIIKETSPISFPPTPEQQQIRAQIRAGLIGGSGGGAPLAPTGNQQGAPKQ